MARWQHHPPADIQRVTKTHADMRKILCFFAIVTLCACSSPTPEKQAVLSYIQGIGGTHIDLNARILEMEPAREMVAMDSAVIAWAKYKESEKGTEQALAWVEMAEGYLARQGETLGTYYRCRYQIKNPVLGGAEQEVEKYFIFQGGRVAGAMDARLYASLTKEIEEPTK